MKSPIAPARTSLAAGLAVLLAAPLLCASAASAAPAPAPVEVLHMLGYYDGVVSTFDSATNVFTKIGSIPDNELSGGDFNPVTRLASYIAYVGNGEYTLTSIDPTDSRVVAVVPVSIPGGGYDLQDLDIAADGTARVLLDDGSLGTVDLSSGAVSDLRPILDDLNGTGLASTSAGVLYVVDNDGNISSLTETPAGYAPSLVSESAATFRLSWVADFDSNDVLWFDSYGSGATDDELWRFDSATPTVPATRVTALANDAGGLYFVTPPVLPLVAGLSVGTIAAGGQVTVTGENFTPEGDVRVELHSDPVVLGTTQADAAGRVTFAATIPAGTLPDAHAIHLFDLAAGTSTSMPITVSAAVAPTLPPTPTPTPSDTPTTAPAPATGSSAGTGSAAPVAAELAATGTSAAGGALLGGVSALVLGLGLLIAVRRRHASV